MSEGRRNKISGRAWFGIFLAWTIFGLWNFGVNITDNLASQDPLELRDEFVQEMTGAYSGFLMTPFLLWFMGAFLVQRKNARRRIPLHVLTSALYAGCFIAMMYGSRTTLWRLFGWGEYNYGIIAYRALMEYLKILVLYWAVFGILNYVRARRERQRQELRASELEQQLSRARLQALQMQVHPHFLFNTLNTISSTLYEDAKAADSMIMNLSDLLRKTLDGGGKEEHTLAEEMEIIAIYLDIMKARFKDKLTVTLDIPSELRDALVPVFILQPLAENSIKYGTAALGAAEIRLAATRRGDRTLLIVEDKGPGLSRELGRTAKNGLGLSNTSERLEKLYGPDQRFVFENIDEGGLRISIDIPFRRAGSAESQG
jgi:two-component sensor histidine kinase